ncbi:hypothetical protein RHGRI_028338 [Rhododendron griersonianum]|uniref:USP domain-containing protein n=1 Tax=Rhododendron griersonianum TaxID=479676 RepID=A0AAV6IL21_9ERIC|nr:hypothetical protein RHGRI_028338 [Rhododendron griersonianum]
MKNPPMGLNNKNGKNPPPRLPSAAPENANQGENKTDQLSLIKSQCRLAIAALRRNPAKAHRLMEDACRSHPDCALVHAVRGNLHAVEASRIASSESVLKQKHWRSAVELARRAASLSPNSIEFRAFYAQAMYNASRDVEGFEEAARECERALSIENPISPAEEVLVVKEESTAEELIYGVRKRLKWILGKCREASLSLKKNLGKEIPLKGVIVAVPVDRRPRNGNRNEIKIRVSEERSEPDSFRMRERKRQAFREEREGAAAKMGKSRTYWDAMSDERKMGLIGVRVGDLRKYCCSVCKDGFAERVFSEVIGYAEKNRSWKFWGCYYCDEKFGDLELRLKHIEREHEGEIGQKLKVKPFEFPEIDAEWADMLVNGTWEPVDIPRAIKMIEKQLKSQKSRKGSVEENRGKAQVFDQDPNRSPLCCGSGRRNNDETLFGFGNCKSIPYFLPRACRNDRKWPLSDDIERANILQEIHRQFQVLVRYKFLTGHNLSTVITCTVAELQNFIPASQLQSQGLEKSPLCICFLEVPQLKKILELLQCVYEVSGSDFGRSDDRKRCLITGRIFLTGDSSCLFDDCLLRVEVKPHRHHDGVEDDSDGSASTCSICDDEVAVPPDIDAFTKWLFKGPPTSTAEQLASWTHLLDDMKHDGMEASKDFEQQFNLFESLRSKQSKLLGQCTSLQAIESICAQELEKREQGGKHVPQSYESLLKKYAKEDSMSELDVIVGVVTEARKIHHLGVEEALNNSSYRSNVIRSTELEDQEDASIRMAIQKEMEQSLSELCRIEEPITRNGGIMWRRLAIYKHCSCDYRGIMLPIVRNFIHAKLEALVNEEEKQKSDALTEALLSELALDTKKNTSEGNSDPKLSKKTSKTKKKIKGLRKVKDPKATCGDELHLAHEETAKQDHFPVVAVSADDLKLREQELRENFILEDRKLKEKLEYQRKVEDEAKQMALAKGTTNEAAPIKVEESTKPVVVCSQRTKRRRKKDTLQASKNLSLAKIPELEDDLGVLSTCSTLGTISGSDILNPGLRNDTGEYTCFVNVIVQTFWNLRKFREAFTSRATPKHVHIGDPCVVCALKEIFIALSEASANKEREAISPTSLRNALIKLNPDSNIFCEPHMYDTSEALAIVLDSLHKSAVGSKCAEGSWDCGSDACIAHELFGMDILEKIICSNCVQNMQPESHFDEIFKLAERNYVDCEPQFACDPEIGGCGKRKSLLSYLRTPPHVFAIALLWPTDSESREDISATLTALTTEIDMAVFHDGLDLGKKHSLFSMVCYFAQHHICFAYSQELEKWIMYDDETVKEVGCWDDVISTCERGCLQPQFLFFEAVK